MSVKWAVLYLIVGVLVVGLGDLVLWRRDRARERASLLVSVVTETTLVVIWPLMLWALCMDAWSSLRSSRKQSRKQ